VVFLYRTEQAVKVLNAKEQLKKEKVARLSRKALDGLSRHSCLTEQDVLDILQSHSQVERIGEEPGTNKVHIVFYSPPDKKCLVAVQDQRTLEILEIMSPEQDMKCVVSPSVTERLTPKPGDHMDSVTNRHQYVSGSISPKQIRFDITFVKVRGHRHRVVNYRLSRMEFPSGITDVHTNEAVKQHLRAHIISITKTDETLVSVNISVSDSPPVRYSLE